MRNVPFPYLTKGGKWFTIGDYKEGLRFARPKGMRLSKVLERLEVLRLFTAGSETELDPEISAVVFDSRKVVPGCLFVCIVGNNTDGHKYIPDVVAAGAAAVLVEAGHLPELLPEGTVYAEVANTRRGLALASAAWFGYPAEHLPVIGITGTKGKTTTTYMVKAILDAAGIPTGLIGTIEIIIKDEHIHATHTTPESYFVQEYLARMLAAGCRCCVMEVSSQALMLDRTAGIPFEIGVFTNLGRDHIGKGEHKDFEDYLHCKSLLFQQCKIGLVNLDDPYVQRILENATCRVETFGVDSEDANLRATNIEHIHEPGYLGVRFEAVAGSVPTAGLAGDAEESASKVAGDSSSDFHLSVTLQIPGKFSVYNALTAIGICRHFGVPADVMKEALANARVRGRVELVPVSDKYTLLIDYAHNAMALESLLKTLRDYHPHRLVSVFGCGGNRATDRRFKMGEVSGKEADFTIITSDNPRFEEPEAIMADIRTGMQRTNGKFIEIVDRKEAIAYAIAHGEPGDIIVIAGKGHEDYQEIRGVRYPMDDRELVREILEEGKALL